MLQPILKHGYSEQKLFYKKRKKSDEA